MSDYGTVDISMTSISSRTDGLHHTLRSVLTQSYSDVRINLYLSKEPYLLDKGFEDVPETLLALQQEYPGQLRIVFVPNTGPYRKLVPFLRENWGLSKLVVTADDDTIYPETWLQGLLDAYGRYQCVISYRGHQINVSSKKVYPYLSWMRSRITLNPSPLILPTGKDGVLYNTAFFPISVLNMDVAMRIAPTVDDLWFRWNLAYNGINAFIVNTDYRSGTFEETDFEDSLFLNFNRTGGNDHAIASIERFFSTHYGFGMPHLA